MYFILSISFFYFSGKGLYSCSGCRQVSYCSAAHQKQHWTCHKSDCKEWKNLQEQSGEKVIPLKTQEEFFELSESDALKLGLFPPYEILIEEEQQEEENINQDEILKNLNIKDIGNLYYLFKFYY